LNLSAPAATDASDGRNERLFIMAATKMNRANAHRDIGRG
jgi:hypothetical protein